jgi:hypothetical protein
MSATAEEIERGMELAAIQTVAELRAARGVPAYCPNGHPLARIDTTFYYRGRPAGQCNTCNVCDTDCDGDYFMRCHDCDWDSCHRHDQVATASSSSTAEISKGTATGGLPQTATCDEGDDE